MEIEEVRTRKTNLESEILRFVKQFKHDTDVTVESIHCYTMDISGERNPRIHRINVGLII